MPIPKLDDVVKGAVGDVAPELGYNISFLYPKTGGIDLDFGILEAEHPDVGAGPFVLEERRGEEWRLRRNEHYFGGAPKVRRLVFKTIRDDNSRLLALVGGSGDLTQNTISPLLHDAVAAQKRLKVETGRSSVYTYLGFNMDDRTRPARISLRMASPRAVTVVTCSTKVTGQCASY